MIPMLSDTLNHVSSRVHATKRIAKRRGTCATALAVLFALGLALPAHAQQFQLLYAFHGAKPVMKGWGEKASSLLRVNGNFYGHRPPWAEGRIKEPSSSSPARARVTNFYTFNRFATPRMAGILSAR